jgi:hypothetical protein
MPRSDQGRYVVGAGALILSLAILTGTLFFTFSLGDMSGRKDAEAAGYAASYTSETTKEIAECSHKANSYKIVVCVKESIDSSRDAQRSEADLGVQRQMSDWTFWALVLAVLSFTSTAIGTAFLIWQVMLTREAVNGTVDATQAMLKANKIAESAQRPWLNVKVTIHSARFNRDGVKFYATVEVENIGLTPAENVCIHILCSKGEYESQGNVDVRKSGRPEILRSFRLDQDGPCILPKGSRNFTREHFVKWDDLNIRKLGIFYVIFFEIDSVVTYNGLGFNGRTASSFEVMVGHNNKALESIPIGSEIFEVHLTMHEWYDTYIS